MNKKIFVLCIHILTGLIACPAIAGGLLDKQALLKPGEQIFGGIVEEKKKQLKKLEEEKKSLEETQDDFKSRVGGLLQETRNRIRKTQQELVEKPDNEFLKQKESTLNESYQVLKDLQRARDELLSLQTDFIKELQDFVADPDFATYKKENKLQERVSYTFEDLQKLHNKILDQEKRLASLKRQEKSAGAELESRKQSIEASKQEQKETRQELSKGQEPLTLAESQTLLELKEQYFGYKQELDQVRIQEIKTQIEYLAFQLYIEKSHAEILDAYLRKIKPSIRVSQVDVTDAQEAVAKEKQKFFLAKEQYSQSIDALVELEKQKEQELEQLSKKFNIPLGRDIDDWSKEPQQTVNAYLGLCEVGALNSYIQMLNRRQDLLNAYISLENEKYNNAQMEVQIKETYHRLTTRKLASPESIAKEIKKYDTARTEAQANLARYNEKIKVISNQLNEQKKILDNIVKRREDIQNQKNILFRTRPREYVRCFDRLNMAEQRVKEQIDILSSLTGVYSGITSTISSTLRLINFITSELKIDDILGRPEYAISWAGFQSILSDVLVFLNDIRSYITQFRWQYIPARINNQLKQPASLFFFLLKLFLLILGLLFFKRSASDLAEWLIKSSENNTGVFRVFSLFLAMLVQFLHTYFYGIALWIILLALVWLQVVYDPYLYIFFYLFSIPYLLYLANRFIKYFAHFNVRHDHVFVDEDFQRRFVLVLSVLLYSTIFIFFFREAFMLANYYKSELPTILLAINIVIFQISIILLLITKEQILNLIPQRPGIWQWIRERVDRYYYLLLLGVIAIIVMGNPYVGFGKLVRYILTGMILTALLVVLLLWVHGLIKRLSSRIFFVVSDDVVRERFSNAKTWFGLSIIASFVLLSFIGVIIAAKIWGQPVMFKDVFALMKKPILLEHTQNPITVVSLLQIIGFILLGFLGAYALNRFVLDKIFDLLLVDPGVQHTVTSIAQYLVVILAIFFGFSNVGLGGLVQWVIAALAFSIGWVLKDPISDFAAYFIILMQRPLKIGDYVQIDPQDTETVGVVRKITARSVVLRRKNSLTIVVPNSQILSKSVVNWNYARNFIAFNDIMVTVELKANPEQVKELLYKAVEMHELILRNPKPIVRLSEFSELGFIFMVRGFVSSAYTLDAWDIASDVRINIVKILRENNIALAWPVRLVRDFSGRTLAGDAGPQLID